MKRLIWIFLCIFLVSCSTGNESRDYFLTPRTLYVTFEDENISVSGRLETSSKQLSFYPDSPEGLCICLTEDGGEVSYGGMVFEGSVAELSRLMPLYRALTEGTLVMNKDGTAEGNSFKLTVHKEIGEADFE